MGRPIPSERFPFVGPTNLAYSPYIDAERSINLYYEPSYQGGGPALIGTPGVSAPIATLPSVPLGGNVRALFAGNGRLFAVGGSHFYELGTTIGSGIIQDYGAMAGDNALSVRSACQIVGGTASPMILVCNPYSSQIYFVNTGAFTMDSKFNGLALEYLDGFFFAIATGASLAGTNPNQISASAFNDGTTWSGTAFVIQEGTSDAITQLAVVNNLLWVFGQKNITIYYNAGLPNFPLARVNGGTINIGCIAPQTVAKIANTVMWLGGSERGHGVVYIANGFQPKRVSTAAIEQKIAALTPPSANSLGKANAFAYSENGHEFYVLNIDGGLPLVYDVTTGVWHERTSGATSPSFLVGAGLAWCFASVETSPSLSWVRSFVGDRNTGNVYYFGQQYTSENGTAIYRQRTATHLSDSLEWIKYPRFEVHADIGTAALNLMYSNDGGKTFPALNRPDVSKTGSNDQGINNPATFPRYYWTQCGRSRKRTFGVWMLDGNNPVTIAGGYAWATEGRV